VDNWLLTYQNGNQWNRYFFNIYFINRYGVNNQFDFDEKEFFDEAYNTTEDDSESNLENVAIPAEPQPNFVTLSRVQNKPILPPVVYMGGRLRETIEEETMDYDEDDDEGFVEGTILSQMFSKNARFDKGFVP
jgi:hypothetical protein